MNQSYLESELTLYFNVADVIMFQATVLIESKKAGKHCYYQLHGYNV